MDKQFVIYYKIVGINVAHYRNLQGISQKRLAELIGEDIAVIEHIEAADNNNSISLDILFRIGKALNIPTYKFFEI